MTGEEWQMRMTESWAWTTDGECELNKTSGPRNCRQTRDKFRASTVFEPITSPFTVHDTAQSEPGEVIIIISFSLFPFPLMIFSTCL